MENIKVEKEYYEYLKSRIFNKLTKTNEYELLTNAYISINLLLRQSDILRLKWEQVDFNNKTLNNVLIKKDEREAVVNYNLSNELFDILEIWYRKTSDKINIFPTLKKYEVGRKISDLIGVPNFNTHELRNIEILLFQ